MSLTKALEKRNPSLRVILIKYLDEIKVGLSKGYTKKAIYDYFEQESLTKSNYTYFVKILNSVLKGSGGPRKRPLKKFHIEDIEEKDFE